MAVLAFAWPRPLDIVAFSTAFALQALPNAHVCDLMILLLWWAVTLLTADAIAVAWVLERADAMS